MILYRRMGEGDVPAGLALCRSTGWNQTPEDWELFLRLSPKGCCVAVDDDGEADCYAAVPANGSGDVTVETREVQITLDAELTNDDFVNLTLTQNVRVRNDWVRSR